MTTLSPIEIATGPRQLMATTQDERHRKMLTNYCRHAMLEVSGRWEEILVPEMMVPHPRYRINFGGQEIVMDGMAESSRSTRRPRSRAPPCSLP